MGVRRNVGSGSKMFVGGAKMLVGEQNDVFAQIQEHRTRDNSEK